jgi:hypothetical protein
MQEDFLQYLWKYGLFPADRLFTETGERVEVISIGQFNTDAGPDFLYSRIRIAGTLWVGHTEIHVKATDWFRHKHHEDPAYEPVVLHVVYERDCQVRRTGGLTVPTVLLPVKQHYLDSYHRILSTLSPVPCGHSWKKLEPFEVESWLVSMGVERMQMKSAWILSLLAENQGGWEETLIHLVFRSFGFGINQDAFEQLGRSVPIRALRKAVGNHFRVEAVLYGQAGMIPAHPVDAYSRALATEYEFLRKKYNLPEPSHPGWKFLRMRPSNFPTVRMAQLAAFLAGNPDLFSSVINTGGHVDPESFEFPVSAYWKVHYDFEKKWTGAYPGIGQDTINLFRINAAVPFAATYANRQGEKRAREQWMETLEVLPAESNRITRIWASYGYRVPNAFYSQAFLHLFNVYCHPRKCLSCRIGQFLIRNP